MIRATTAFERHASDYWRLSRIWHKQSKESSTTEEAIAITNHLLSNLNPNRPLWTYVANLQCDIVEYGTKRNKKTKPQKATVLMFTTGAQTKTALLAGKGAASNG